jgi:predicted solute-binding protein
MLTKTKFDPKPNQGFIFKNKFKKEENHPDLKGDVYLDIDLISQLIKESKYNVIKLQIGAYIKTSTDGSKYLAIYASRPYLIPNTSQASGLDDDIPF